MNQLTERRAGDEQPLAPGDKPSGGPPPSTFVARRAPIVYLFPYSQNGDPVFDPCSVEWYLENVELVDAAGNPIAQQASQVESQLPTYVASDNLQINDPDASSPVRAGNLQSAVAYVHIKPIGPCFDLQYWFLYAVRGRSTFRVQPFLGSGTPEGEYDHDLDAPPPPPPQPYQGAGEHQGDWKYITVRIDASGDVQAVFYGQHAGGIWCLPTSGGPTLALCSSMGGQPVVYSSRNTHSCFPVQGRTDQQNTLHKYAFLNYGVDVSLLEWPSDGGEQWNTSQPIAPVVVCDETLDPPPPFPDWLQFHGHWGPPLHEVVDPSTFKQLVGAVVDGFPLLKPLAGDIENALADEAQGFVEDPQTGAETPANQSEWAGSVGWQANWQGVGPNSFKGNPGMPVTTLRQVATATTQVFLSDNNGFVYTIAGTQEQGWPASWTRIGSPFKGNTPYMPVTAMWRDDAQTTVDIFLADDKGHVYTASGVNADWSSSTFTPIDYDSFTTIPGAPVTAIWHASTHTSVDLFTVDNKGHIYVANGIPGGTWGSFVNPWGEKGFSGNPGMPVTALWRDAAQSVLDLFVAKGKGYVYTVSASPAADGGWNWSSIGWKPIDGFTTNPGALVTAVWRASGEAIDLFTSDNKGHVYTISGTPSSSGWQWSSGFNRVDPTFTGDSTAMPVSAQWCVGPSLSLFVTDANGTAQNLVFDPGNWTPGGERFSPIVPAFVGSPGAPVAVGWHDPGQTILDLTIADTDNNGRDGRVFTIAGCPFS